jgi:hypothetical protein
MKTLPRRQDYHVRTNAKNSLRNVVADDAFIRRRKQFVTESNFKMRRLIGVTALAATLGGAAMGQAVAFKDWAESSVGPVEIRVPPGNTLYVKGHASGTQNYICLPSGWTFLGPQATLFRTIPGLTGLQMATHFLSANPDESGMARPTWQGSLDTSIVWGKAIANSTNPDFVAPGAIPWLLVQAVGSQHGPMGGSALSQTTYIQRVNTSGGVAPAAACTVGAVAFMPYTADYYFYKAER